MKVLPYGTIGDRKTLDAALDLSGADLQGVNLEGVDLAGADLSGANCTGANFCGGKLRNTNFTNCILREARFSFFVDAGFKEPNPSNLPRTDLSGASLPAADCRNTNFGDSILKGSTLTNADLRDANFSRADLRGADLSYARLKRSRLTYADLRAAVLIRATGYVLDKNRIKGTQFSRSSKDPWNLLRRNYTGSRLLFNLVFLLIFFVPYVAKSLYWAAINKTQIATNGSMSDATEKIIQSVSDDSSRREIELVVNTIKEGSICLAESCESVPIWSLILGLDKGYAVFVLTCVLILYNVLRAILTYSIDPLREEEERSGYVPGQENYILFFRMHQLLQIVKYVAFAAILWNIYYWMLIEVMVPA